MPKIVFIEGNIGSGKSTAVKYLMEEYPNFIYLLEPVEEWKNLSYNRGAEIHGSITREGYGSINDPINNYFIICGGGYTEVPKYNILEEMYNDPSKYAFSFQTYVFLSRMKKLIEIIDREIEQKSDKVIICERSIFTDKGIFVEVLSGMSHINDLEKTIYNNLWDFWIKLMSNKFKDIPISFLYIQCEPENALQHVQIRGRSEENNVKLDYLEKLHKHHEELYNNPSSLLYNMISKLNRNYNNAYVFIISNNDTKTDLVRYLDKWVETKVMTNVYDNIRKKPKTWGGYLGSMMYDVLFPNS